MLQANFGHEEWQETIEALREHYVLVDGEERKRTTDRALRKMMTIWQAMQRKEEANVG